MSGHRIQRQPTDLIRDFQENFARLVRANESYDQGHFYEAMTIASLVYVLVHEGGRRSPSLLATLDRKSGMHFVDTARPIHPANLVNMVMPLVYTQISGESAELLPNKNNFSQTLPSLAFLKWWEKPVLRDDKRRVFSRKNLIHFFRHTLGGGHVGRFFESQDTLDGDAFASLRDAYARAYTVEIDGQRLAPQYGPEYVSVRQIGWEMEQTLKNSCNDLLLSSTTPGPNMHPIAGS